MKNWIYFVLVTGGMSLIMSCQKEATTDTSYDAQIQNIINDNTKQELSVSSLPQEITAFVTENFAPEPIVAASYAQSKGYELELGDGSNVYFDTRTKPLNGNDGRHRGRGPCMRGDSTEVDSLPADVITYINTNYPGTTIVSVKKLGDHGFSVKLSNDKVLLFDAAGKFIEECKRPNGPGGGGHGGKGGPKFGGDVIDPSTLPADATDYITKEHAGVTIEKAILRENGDYFVLLSDKTLLVFDKDGKLKFDSSK